MTWKLFAVGFFGSLPFWIALHVGLARWKRVVEGRVRARLAELRGANYGGGDVLRGIYGAMFANCQCDVCTKRRHGTNLPA